MLQSQKKNQLYLKYPKLLFYKLFFDFKTKYLMVISLILTISLSLFFFFLNHPLILTIILTTQTINLRIIIFLKKNHSWFSYILFIIFLRGIIIIFVYISSLASNQPLKLNKKTIFIIILSLLLIVFGINFNFISINTITQINHLNPFLDSIIKIYENNLSNFTVLLILYLLIVLIIIVNISKKIKLPSRTH